MMNSQNQNPHCDRSALGRGASPLWGVLAALLLAACGADSEPSNVQSKTAQPNESAAATSGVDIAAATTPEEIGQAVADIYVQAFADLSEALADHPDAAKALERTRAVHERHVQDLVALGRKVEGLSEGDKATVRSAVSRAQSGLRYDPEIKPIYERYTALNSHYIDTGAMSSNREFNRLFAGFNILTQYAFFDLLKRQNPEEAERLGL